MLRDIGSALILAAVFGTLYSLGIYLSPMRSIAGSGACDLLVLLGIVLSAAGFVAELIASMLNRRLRGTTYHRPDAVSHEKAKRLNAYVATLAGCTSRSSGSSGASGSEWYRSFRFPLARRPQACRQ